jgi:hypothetical protein
MPMIARYGSWKSPITSELIVAQSIALSETRLDGDRCYWLEGRPQEQGRFVVVSSDAAGTAATDLTPKSFSARTRVHEYGGASWTVVDGVVYFSNFADGRLYRTRDGASAPEALTPARAIANINGDMPMASSIADAIAGSACARTTRQAARR